MSKVRREKHKTVVFWSKIGKELDKVFNIYNNKPRWRQWEKSEYEMELKNEQNR